MPVGPEFEFTSLPDRWRGFLTELDRRLTADTYLYCLGGFVVTVLYGVERDTGDLDALEILPREAAAQALEVGGRGSSLLGKTGLYLDQVGVADYPDSYEDRLYEPWPESFTRLRLLILEIHDVVLAKLARNNERDRFDVEALARAGYLDPEVLQTRYHDEMRSYLAPMIAERHDLTLRLWMKKYFSQDA